MALREALMRCSFALLVPSAFLLVSAPVSVLFDASTVCFFCVLFVLFIFFFNFLNSFVYFLFRLFC